MVHSDTIHLKTKGFSDIINITDDVRKIAQQSKISEGIISISAIGSTASITTIEYEPALVKDMQEALEKLWPEEMHTRHGSTWGDDNGFSHLRASFLGPSITVPLNKEELVLGTWQQIICIDHDNSPRDRKIFVQIVGE
ncbi:MAG: secondary thiamine-phosphate synthase enzyme YjbQ [Fidelibacterota bacterium]